MSSIIFVHGAYSTRTSFNYLKQPFENCGKHLIFHEYNCNDRVDDLLTDFWEEILNAPKHPDDGDRYVDIIGHSLGGVLATASCLSPTVGPRIRKVATIGSPLGGIEATQYLKWFMPREQLFKTVSPSGLLAKAIRNADWHKNEVNRLHVITTEGHSPVINKPNDGVVSVDSQTAISSCMLYYAPVNHFEGLLSEQVSKKIEEFIKSE